MRQQSADDRFLALGDGATERGPAALPDQAVDESGAHPDDARDPSEPFGLRVARVPGEQLVATIPRECDGHLPARETGHEDRRDLRRVGERFVVDARQCQNDVLRLARGQLQLGVVGAQMVRDGSGVRRLVESVILEADGERPDRTVGDPLHRCDDQ